MHPEYNASELSIELPNQARFYLLSGTNFESIRGVGLHGAVMDEVALMPPSAWSKVIRPALSDHQGPCTFIGTPAGMGNLFYRLYSEAPKNGWFHQTLTWKDTDVIAAQEIQALKQEMSAEEFEQEYECSFTAAVKGAFFGKYMAQAERDGRITSVPWEASLPVHTSWDLGMADLTVIVFWQQTPGGELRIINCLSYANTGLPEIKKQLDQLPYTYGSHYGPHDIKVREIGSGRSRLETARDLGIEFTVAPNKSVRDGIEAVRGLLPKCWFDREKCFDLVEGLKTYRTEYDELRQVFHLTPLHSWESHYADAVRMFAVAHRDDGFSRPLNMDRLNRIVR